MEKWSVSVNGYYGVARISVNKGRWWFFAIDFLSDHICSLFRWAPGYEYLCVYVHGPITQWCFNHYEERGADVPLGTVINGWGKDAPGWWREEWDRGTAMWKEFGPPNTANGGVLFRTNHPHIQAPKRLY